MVAMAREGVEDVARHKNDDFMNSKKCIKINIKHKQKIIKWKEI